MITYLIDYSTHLYRFKSAYSWAHKDISGVKQDISSLVGSIRSLKSNIYDNIVIVLDGFPMRSSKVYPSYKGTRVKEEAFHQVGVPKLELIQFLTKIGEVLGKNISVVCSPCQETDEVISSLVHHIVKQLPPRAQFISNLNQRHIEDDRMLSFLNVKSIKTSTFIPEEGEAIISTTDGDFIQLQRFDHVYIDKSISGKEVTNTWMSKSTHSLAPCPAIIYKAICGDQGDNIPAILNPTPSLIKQIQQFQNEESVLKFYESIFTGVELKAFRELWHAVYKERAKFLNNWDVAFLKFVSYPIKLEFSDYRIEETIERYGLRI